MTCITAHRNQDQLIGKSHLCRAIITLQTRSKTHNNTLQSKQEIIRFHLHPSAIIYNTRPAKCLLNLTQPQEPLQVITSSVTYPQHPATQTCNCCLQVVDISTWNHVKITEDSWNEVPKTGSKLNVVSHLFHVAYCTAFPPRPSCRIVLRLDGGAGGQQHLDHLQAAFPSREVQRPVASARGLR